MTNPSLRLNKWPARDRAAWEVAIADGGLLDDRGPAALWAPKTRATNIHSYGRFLAFVEREVGLEDEDTADRCTRAMVGRYIAQLQATTASKSVSSSITGLLVMLQAMVPDRDWTWLMKISNRLQRSAKPSRDKRSRMMPADEIMLAAQDRLTELAAQGFAKRAHIVEYRNVLIIAMLTACPIRRKNMAALTVGKHLIRQPDCWSVDIPAAEVKNKVRLDPEYPESLTAHIDLYVEVVRPLLVRHHDDGRLWLNWYGAALSEQGIYGVVVAATQKLLGRSLPPHLFRDIAVTTVVTESPAATMATRGLLGHTKFETTEEHYVQADQISARRKVNELLQGMRNKNVN